MRGRDGITSQNTVRKPFEKAASVDVAALTALLRGVTIADCVPGTTQKRKKESPALFSIFSIFQFSSFRENGKKKRFPENSRTPKARGAKRKKDSPS
jgi:hypothetical protein